MGGWEGIAMLAGYLLVGVLAYGMLCSGRSIVNAPDEYEDSMDRNILPGRTSPTGANGDLQQALLEDDWEDGMDPRRKNGRDRDGDLKRELSEIETANTTGTLV